MTLDQFGGTDFLYSLGNFGIRPGLTTIRAILAKLGNPDQHPGIIHIAGTNGKGSTVMWLERLLMASGFSVGATLSPHLMRFNERFRVNGAEIDDTTLHNLLIELYDACGITPKNLTDPDSWALRPTFFELTVALAHLWFRRSGVDFVLLETGMGGRLDATNTGDTLLQIITPISLDHQRFLGDSLEKIAGEKAGIIKPGRTLIIGKQEPHITATLQAIAAGQSKAVYSFGEHVSYTVDETAQKLTYRLDCGDTSETIELDFPVLPGRHQFDNLAVCLLAYRLVCPEKKRMPPRQLNAALSRVRFKGRLHQISKQPPVWCDGAHNEAGVQTLIRFLTQEFTGGQVFIAINRSQDKNMIHAFTGCTDPAITFQPLTATYHKMADTDTLSAELAETGRPVNPAVSTHTFCRRLKQNPGEFAAFDAVIVCGSLYLLGEFYAAWEHMQTHASLDGFAFQNTNV